MPQGDQQGEGVLRLQPHTLNKVPAWLGVSKQ